jgi:hypothetical protein
MAALRPEVCKYSGRLVGIQVAAGGRPRKAQPEPCTPCNRVRYRKRVHGRIKSGNRATARHGQALREGSRRRPAAVAGVANSDVTGA